MRRDARAFLWDVQHATDAILRFTAGLDARAYADNEVITAAVMTIRSAAGLDFHTAAFCY
jgi:uncharacterized protein with HEPN domain